jgi:hypothetical protein
LLGPLTGSVPRQRSHATVPMVAPGARACGQPACQAEAGPRRRGRNNGPPIRMAARSAARTAVNNNFVEPAAYNFHDCFSVGQYTQRRQSPQPVRNKGPQPPRCRPCACRSTRAPSEKQLARQYSARSHFDPIVLTWPRGAQFDPIVQFVTNGSRILYPTILSKPVG